MTWDVWQVRGLDAAIPNLPWFATPPQFDFGWLLLASLVLTAISPRRVGFVVHVLILFLAIATDQMRCQPQIISVVVLMAACIFPTAKRLGVWFLIAMWFWAGVHKLLSPDWYGSVTYYLLLRPQFKWGTIHLWDYHVLFAVIGGITELGLGVLAWLRPKIAAPICFLMHMGIATFLIVINWNFSVLPWNFCTAIVGGWLLWTVKDIANPVSLPKTITGRLAVAIMLLSPIGFYFGMVRHSLCHVLYSLNYPDAVITKDGGPVICEATKELRMPFPHEPKAFVDLFRMTGKPGEKLHIREHRPWMPSHYFEMSQQQTVVEISHDQFFNDNNEKVPGIAFDDRRKLYQLAKEFHRANVDLKDGDPAISKMLKRKRREMIWSMRFTPSKDLKQSYQLIDGLPNLEELQLSGSNVTDDDLRYVSGALRLRAIGLDDTAITNEGLRHLEDLPDLKLIFADRTQVTQEAIDRITGQ